MAVPQPQFACKARLATREDLGAIRDFYIKRRTDAVYLRTEEAIGESIDNELFQLVLNNNNEIIASVGVYIVNKGRDIQECFVEENGRIVASSCAEVGSVLKWPEWDSDLSKNQQVSGAFHPFLFGAAMLNFCTYMLKNWNNEQVDIKSLICEVHADRTRNIRRLIGAVALTPFKWRMLDIASGLKSALGITVDATEKNQNVPKFFFQALVSNLPAVASYMLNVLSTHPRDDQRGLTNGEPGKRIECDMTAMADHWTMGYDQEGKCYTLPGRLKANRKSIEGRDVTWVDFAREFERYCPDMGKPVNGFYQASADKVRAMFREGKVLLSRQAEVVRATRVPFEAVLARRSLEIADTGSRAAAE